MTPLAGLRAAAPDLRLHHDDGSDPAGAAALAARCEAALVVVGLDWRHEGEHIHPGDLAPILCQAPPPTGCCASAAAAGCYRYGRRWRRWSPG